MSWKTILEKVKAGKTVSQKDLQAGAEGALNRDSNASNAVKKERMKAATQTVIGDAETAATLGVLEVARGYREAQGKDGLKVKGREVTTVGGLLVQGVGIWRMFKGKKDGAHINALGRGATFSGLAAQARELGAAMAKGKQKANEPEAPQVQGRHPGARQPGARPPAPRPRQVEDHNAPPEVIVSPGGKGPERARLRPMPRPGQTRRLHRAA